MVAVRVPVVMRMAAAEQVPVAMRTAVAVRVPVAMRTAVVVRVPAAVRMVMDMRMLVFDTTADPKDVNVGMPYVHLTYAPRLVPGWLDDLDTGSPAHVIHRVDVLDPHRHPDASGASAVDAENDLAGTAADRAGVGRVAPLPQLGPAQRAGPGELASRLLTLRIGVKPCACTPSA